MWQNWVLDATMDCEDGVFCFCPIEGDLASDDWQIVTGVNVASDHPPGKLVAIVHQDGQEAVDEFCKTHAAAIEKMRIEENESLSLAD